MVIYGNHNCTDIMTSPLIIGRRPETSCPGSVRALKTLAWRQANWAAALHLCQWTMYEIGFPALPVKSSSRARDSESADLISEKLPLKLDIFMEMEDFHEKRTLHDCWFQESIRSLTNFLWRWLRIFLILVLLNRSYDRSKWVDMTVQMTLLQMLGHGQIAKNK